MSPDILDSIDFSRNKIIIGSLGLVFLVGFLATTFTSFTSHPPAETGRSYGEPQKLEASSGLGGTSADSSYSSERKLATSIHMDLKVGNVEEAISTTKKEVSSYSGFVESENIDRDHGRSGRLTVKVPDSNRSEFLEGVENRWKVESKNINTDDVTDRHTELKLELKNKKQELDRLEELLNRSENVDQTIKVQERMSELRSRIQYLDNQLNDLNERVEYTRISLRFEEPQPITAEFEPQDALSNAYRGVFQSLELIIVGIGYLLPFGLLAAAGIFLRRFWKKRA